ncbi:MAG: energy transducer TonB [Xanthomonadales bacterium]|nr:energy transducer TonB [Xanthomonadales bacterium]
MTNAMRTTAMLPAGAFMAVALFLLMHSLIAAPPDLAQSSLQLPEIRFEAVSVEPEIPPLPEPPPKPPEPIDPPEAISPPIGDPFDRADPPLEFDLPDFYGGSGLGMPIGPPGHGGSGDSPLVPLVRIQPMYPRQAALRGIEGHVVVAFTVTETGAVIDPIVVSADPPRIFDRAAMAAVLKWKFRPPEMNGKTVSKQATQRLEFRLADR